MNEALCSILCAEQEWRFDTEGRVIKFNKDGTGELWCRCNYNYWIAAEIEWKSIEPPPLDHVECVEPLDQITNIGNITQNKNPYLCGQLNLEITLTKRLPPHASMLSQSTMINELSLMDSAFQPKLFTIRLEKGNFIEPCSIGSSSLSTKPRFVFRLVFDKSPYPPQSEWKKSDGGPESGQFWNHKEFVARKSPGLETQGRAMNDSFLAGWGNCVVS